MKFLHRHWYDLSAIIGALILAALFVFWGELSVLQRLSIANLAVIFFHFYEEFGFPGGFGTLANTVLYKSSPAPDRWPLNQNSVMIGNWSFALLFYVPPIIFPHLIWLGLMPMLFGGVGQLLAHGVLNTVMLKRAGLRYRFNSGLVTTLLGHVPLAIAYGYAVETMGLATAWDWVIGFAYAVFAYAVVFRLIIMKSLENADSPYPFDDAELKRFDRLYGRRSPSYTTSTA